MLSTDSGYVHPASSCISMPAHCAQETELRVSHNSASYVMYIFSGGFRVVPRVPWNPPLGWTTTKKVLLIG